jgi:ATP-binding cassette, subfamily B, heavy metal transporter
MLQTNPISSSALPKHSWSANLAASLSGISEVWRKLWPYVWPSGRRDLQMRMYATFVLLVVGKLVTVAVPYAFKWATDSPAIILRITFLAGWSVRWL